jgi:hypothetical protein
MGEAAKGYAARAMRGLEAARTGGKRRRLRVVESLALGGRRQLLLVMCDEQEYLVGTGAESVETIVPRQPAQMEAGNEGAAAGQTRGSSAWALRGQQPAAAAKAAARPVFGQIPGRIPAQASGVGSGRGGALLRERPAHGPWLMTPAIPGAGDRIVEDRIQEDRIQEDRIQQPEQRRGQHLWQ